MDLPHFRHRRAAGDLLHRPAFWAGVAGVLALASVAYVAAKLREVARLAGASRPYEAHPRQQSARVLIVGDSTGVGTGATQPGYGLAGHLARAYPALHIDNRSQNGARYEDFIRQLQLSDEQYDCVLIVGGANDAIMGTTRTMLRSQVRRALGLAHQRGQRVIVMPPGDLACAPFFRGPFAWWMGRRSRILHAAVQQAAAATGATYVSLLRPREEDPFAQRPFSVHAADHLHPNDAGYRIWFEQLRAQAGLDAAFTGAGAVPAVRPRPAADPPVPADAGAREAVAATPGS